MLSAVTLSRSPPRADTTMMATDDRSRMSRHSSNPSISGSIRSSRTMSGSSVSSRASARSPSVDTTVSKPRTARLDQIRSTMFGSSSTTSARVFTAWSNTAIRTHPRRQATACPRPAASSPDRTLPAGRGPGRGWRSHGLWLDRARRAHGSRIRWLLHWQADPEAGSRRDRFQLDPAAVSGHDPPGYGQPQSGAATATAPGPRHRLERREHELGGHPVAIIGDADRDRARPVGASGDEDPGTRRVVDDGI